MQVLFRRCLTHRQRFPGVALLEGLGGLADEGRDQLGRGGLAPVPEGVVEPNVQPVRQRMFPLFYDDRRQMSRLLASGR